MNYYIIPKNNFKIKLFLLEKPEPINPVISYSLIFHLNDVYTNLLKLEDAANNMTIDHINKIVNPFEFIHTNVPGYQVSVSKVKPESNIFFELMEIFQLCSIFDSSVKNKMNIAHLTPNYKSTNYLLNMMREDNEDNILFEDFDYQTLCDKFVIDINPTKIDLFIFLSSSYVSCFELVQIICLFFFRCIFEGLKRNQFFIPFFFKDFEFTFVKILFSFFFHIKT